MLRHEIRGHVLLAAAVLEFWSIVACITILIMDGGRLVMGVKVLYWVWIPEFRSWLCHRLNLFCASSHRWGTGDINVFLPYRILADKYTNDCEMLQYYDDESHVRT